MEQMVDYLPRSLFNPVPTVEKYVYKQNFIASSAVWRPWNIAKSLKFGVYVFPQVVGKMSLAANKNDPDFQAESG